MYVLNIIIIVRMTQSAAQTTAALAYTLLLLSLYNTYRYDCSHYRRASSCLFVRFTRLDAAATIGLESDRRSVRHDLRTIGGTREKLNTLTNIGNRTKSVFNMTVLSVETFFSFFCQSYNIFLKKIYEKVK